MSHCWLLISEEIISDSWKLILYYKNGVLKLNLWWKLPPQCKTFLPLQRFASFCHCLPKSCSQSEVSEWDGRVYILPPTGSLSASLFFFSVSVYSLPFISSIYRLYLGPFSLFHLDSHLPDSAYQGHLASLCRGWLGLASLLCSRSCLSPKSGWACHQCLGPNPKRSAWHLMASVPHYVLCWLLTVPGLWISQPALLKLWPLRCLSHGSLYQAIIFTLI